MSLGRTIQSPAEPVSGEPGAGAEARRRGARAGGGFGGGGGFRLRLDPLLLLAVLGLSACSLLTIRSATVDDIPGDPTYYVTRQAMYVVAGLILMYGVSRLDYSRLRELKFGVYDLRFGWLGPALAGAVGAVLLAAGLADASR